VWLWAAHVGCRAAVLLIVVLSRFTHPPIWVTGVGVGVGLFGVATVVFGIVYWLQ
jgi:hypothetical protein